MYNTKGCIIQKVVHWENKKLYKKVGLWKGYIIIRKGRIYIKDVLLKKSKYFEKKGGFR